MNNTDKFFVVVIFMLFSLTTAIPALGINNMSGQVRTFSMDTCEYVIITNEELKNANGEYTFQDLIQSKIDKGMTADIFTVEEITNNPNYDVFGPWGDATPSNPFYGSEITGNLELFDDTSARIRNFIRYAYTELGAEYVLLGGDADIVGGNNIVPARGLFADEDGLPLSIGILDHEEDDIPSDVYYACLDGNFNYDCDFHFGEAPKYNDVADIDEADLYAEVYVGRACADSDEEVSNFVKKTLAYDQSTDPYLKDILFIGENLGSLFFTEWGGDYKDEMAPLVPSIYNLCKLYDRDHPNNHWSKEELKYILNTDTPHLINHDGHSYYGYNMRMLNDDVDSLTNDKYFFAYSHGCMAGGFDNPDGYDCIAEHYTVETQHGAFAVIMNARYGLGSEDTIESPSGLYDESFYRALFVENIRELGRANHYSKEYHVSRIDENGMRWCYYQTNLFGDPELSIKDPNTPPDKPTIDGPATGTPGTTYPYDFYMSDPDGNNLLDLEIDFGDEIVHPTPPEPGWPSGSTETVEHSWDEKGTYTISARVMDEHGAWSDWGTLDVTMPYNNLLINPQPSYLYASFTGENGKHMWFFGNLVLYIFCDVEVTAQSSDADMVKFIADKSNGETTTIDIYSDDGVFNCNFGKLSIGFYSITANAYQNDNIICSDSIERILSLSI